MRLKLLSKLKWEIIASIVLLVVTLIYKIHDKNDWDVANIIINDWPELVIFTFLIPSFGVIFHLYRMIETQINNSLSSINSELIREEAHNFGKSSIDTIANTLSTMISEDTSSILWEFKNLDLDNFEKGCLNCGQGGKPNHNCATISNTIKIQRRRRITQIANCLILNSGEYYATETKRPSELIGTDKTYYEIQRKSLKLKNVKKAYRLLILKKDVLKDELANKKSMFQRYISYNIENSNTNEKNISLKIIAFKSQIKDVFRDDGIQKQFYDFVISKKKRKITVFAQNKDHYLTSYDSSHDNNAETAKQFYDAFERLFNHSEDLTGDICFSKEISTFEDVANFINSL